jgi:hypothetical protein
MSLQVKVVLLILAGNSLWITFMPPHPPLTKQDQVLDQTFMIWDLMDINLHNILS